MYAENKYQCWEAENKHIVDLICIFSRLPTKFMEFDILIKYINLAMQNHYLYILRLFYP